MKRIALILLLTTDLCISADSDMSNEQQPQDEAKIVADMLKDRFNPTLIGDYKRAQIALYEKHPEFSELLSIDFLVQEAREKYGIDPQKALPVKDMDPNSVEAQSPLFGYVTSEAVVLNRNRLDGVLHGVCRTAIFHEISHEDDGDHQKLTSVPTSAGLAAAVMSSVYFFEKVGVSRKGIWALPIVVGVFFTVKKFVFNVMHKYIEHKADTKSIKLAACFQCAKELALQRKLDAATSAYQKETINNLPLTDRIRIALNGHSFADVLKLYLSAEEIERLALTLKGKKCKAHELMDEYPVIEKGIEHIHTTICDVVDARREAFIKEKIARLHK